MLNHKRLTREEWLEAHEREFEAQRQRDIAWLMAPEAWRQERVAYWRNMGLSNRSCRVLCGAEIFTIEKLKDFDVRSLLRIPNFGAKSLNEIRTKTGV